MNKLTPKQEAFCREYTVDKNGKQAAIRAKYSEKTAESQASRLLTKDKVRERIEELLKEAADRNDLTVDRVLQEMKNIAFLDPLEMLNEDGTLKKLSEMSEGARRTIAGMDIQTTTIGEKIINEVSKVKIADKRATLVDLGKHLGMFVDKHEHEITGDMSFTMVVHKPSK